MALDQQSDATLHYQWTTPRPALRPAIARIWQLESRGPLDWSPGRWALPDGRAEWLFVIGDALMRDGGRLGQGGHVSGIALRARLSRAGGRVLVVGVVFEPGSAAAALPVPACAITGCAVPLSASWGKSADRLMARLEEAPTFRGRATILEDEIGARLRRRDPEVSDAVYRLAADPGTRIAAIAQGAATARRLERKFLEHVGVSPKRLARVFRLQKALRLWEGGEIAGWAHLAAAAGYADQAHLSREFQDLVGTSPQRFAGGARGLSHSFKTPASQGGNMPP